MDEHRLDRFFREELESYPPPAPKAGAWEKVSGRLTTGGNSSWYRIGLAAMLLLLISSFFLNWRLNTKLNLQQTQLETLTEQYAQIQHRELTVRDTLYIFQTDSIHVLTGTDQYTPGNTSSKNPIKSARKAVKIKSNCFFRTSQSPE